MLELLAPPGLDSFWALLLIAISSVTSFVTASVGIGGGMILLAIMANLLPGAAIIPVHGVVQIGSNVGRTAVLLPNVDWKIVAPFLAGSLLGAALGGLTVARRPPGLIKLGLACFVRWTAWLPMPAVRGRMVTVGTGVVSSFLTMFFGATGAFISAMVKTFQLDRLAHVATQSACMSGQHVLKVLVFGILGFHFAPYAGLIIAMIASGFVGTLLGKQFLIRSNDARFHRLLSVVLTLLAIRLIYEAVGAVWE